MTDLKRTEQDPAGQLWDMLADSHDVMLGSPDPSQHMQPMAPQPAPEENAIWFYARKDSDIAKAAAGGGKVHMCLISDDHDYHACLHGKLETVMSKAHVDRFWSSIVEAWYDHGKDDPALTMLRYIPESAAIWASTGSALKFGWEIAKGNLSDSDPDVGVRTSITF